LSERCRIDPDPAQCSRNCLCGRARLTIRGIPAPDLVADVRIHAVLQCSGRIAAPGVAIACLVRQCLKLSDIGEDTVEDAPRRAQGRTWPLGFGGDKRDRWPPYRWACVGARVLGDLIIQPLAKGLIGGII
jgi:hypothetical protein